MIKKFAQFIKDEEGATAVEYALMAALIAVVIIVSVALLGTNLNVFFTDAATEVGNAGNWGN